MKSVTIKALFSVAVVWCVQHFFIKAVPSIIFKIARHRSAHPLNTIIHAPPISSESRRVVLPNPDFIYSALFFDVRERDITITGTMPDSAQYCSLSFFDSRTMPYRIVNNGHSAAKDFSITLRATDTKKQGVVLLRVLVEDSTQKSSALAVQNAFKLQVQ